MAKKVIAIKYSNKTSHSIKKFLELPFAGKHPKPIQKGAKAAAAEAAVTAAEATAAADFEETKRLAAGFEALGGSAFTMPLAQEAKPGGDFCASAGSHASGSACRRPALSAARKP